jgi:hypothetical protein
VTAVVGGLYRGQLHTAQGNCTYTHLQDLQFNIPACIALSVSRGILINAVWPYMILTHYRHRIESHADKVSNFNLYFFGFGLK